MPFDPSTAKLESGGFDPSTATLAVQDEKPKSDWLRKVALGGRAIGESLVNTADMATLPFRPFRGKGPSPSEIATSFFDRFSYSPETPEERLTMDLAGGAAGAIAGSPTKYALTAAIGGGVGGLASGLARESGASPLTQIGAGLLGNAGAYGLTEALKSGGKAVGRVIDTTIMPGGDIRGARRIAYDAIGDDLKDAVVNQVRSAKPPIPGMPMNFGQMSVGSGSTGAAGLQKFVNQHGFGSDTAQRLKDYQQAMRVNELGTYAKDKPALAAAEAFRSSQADKQFAAAYNTAIKGDPALDKMASNPYYMDAIPDAMKEAMARGVVPKQKLTEYLHMVKKSLDGDLAKSGESGLKPMQKASVTELKTELVDWLKNKNPQYKVAMDDFAKNSEPINQMKVGQYLQDRLRPAMDASERPNAFAEALRNAPATIKRSSGQPFDDLSKVLTPQQMATNQRVLESLQLDATLKELAAAGTRKAQAAVGEAYDPVVQVPMLKTAAMVANKGIRLLEGKGGDASMRALAEMMNNNPKRLADELAKMSPAERASMFQVLQRASISQAGLLGMNGGQP